ncbi:MAG: hypothetical protein M1505_02010 [Patescibacteria group bacterium]|nr:hypothetical protein [Patescibacteria group bacterium]MCL5257981.1 hypothetical protein [Patescibacteria group bacterium]
MTKFEDIIHFNFNQTGFDRVTFERTSEQIQPYLIGLKKKLTRFEYDFPEASILLPRDERIFKNVNDLIRTFNQDEIAAIVLIGIGGSNLGVEAVQSALVSSSQAKKEILFLETVDPINLKKVVDQIKNYRDQNKKIIFVWASKSGKTSETIANYGALADALKDSNQSLFDWTIVITDAGSDLDQYASSRGIKKINLPNQVGGRYSVFSPVGLLPLGLAGFDLISFLRGGQKALELALNENFERNPALAGAVSTFLNFKNGKNIINLFIFNPNLNGLGQWLRQLIGESLGKDNQKLTPIVSIGTTDLHSVGQLYFDGGKDKFTFFISNRTWPIDFQVSDRFGLNNLAAGVERKSLAELMTIILKAVKSVYRSKGLPFFELELERIDEETVGFLFQLKMIEVMFLAQLIGVNAFDQSGVEVYKDEVRKNLGLAQD